MWQKSSFCLPLLGLTGPMHLCSSMGMPIMCLSQKKVTWVPYGGTPSNILCGRIHQLEVHQLLHSEAQVVYPNGLNRCLVPVTTTPPKSLSHGITMLDDEPTLLQVNISQFAMEGCKSKTLFLGSASTATSPTCSATVPPPKEDSSAWPW